jgi:hypothetical protein
MTVGKKGESTEGVFIEKKMGGCFDLPTERDVTGKYRNHVIGFPTHTTRAKLAAVFFRIDRRRHRSA